jgi:glycosyltransferase involved in cell wall biosynthesis
VQALAIARQIDRRGGADHMHAHYANGAGAVARIVHHLTGIPYSFTAHATDIYLDVVDAQRFRRLVHDAAFVATVCEANKCYIELKLLERAEPKLRRLYHGIDLEAFSPDNTPKGEPPLILAVGQLVEKKGFQVLLKACAALRDQQQPFSCIVIGEGPEHEHLERELAQLKLEGLVELRGARLHDEVRALLRRASVVCVPCVTAANGDRDALPTALLEALASGVPVVSTPVGGVPEILGEGEGGLLVHENNAFSLASALRFVLSNRGAAQKLAAQGRQRAERLFDLRRNVAELHTLIKHGTPGHGSTVTIVETPPRPAPNLPRPSPLEEFEI